MNKNDFQEWIKHLPDLTHEQHSEVISRLKILGVPQTHDGREDFGNRILSAIHDVFRKNNIGNMSVYLLKKNPAYASSRQKIVELSEYFDNISKSRLVQDAILRNVIELLYYDLVQMGLPVGPNMILRHIHRIPDTMSRHYPGYAQTGMLTKIVKVVEC